MAQNNTEKEEIQHVQEEEDEHWETEGGNDQIDMISLFLNGSAIAPPSTTLPVVAANAALERPKSVMEWLERLEMGSG